jgi:LexA-binding, inner membrane-associated putative hydrolase
MQGPSHLMISWFAADASGLDAPRDRRIVAWSGLAPDIDVLAYAGAILYYRLDKDLAYENVWQVVHHRYTHGLAFVLLTGVVAWLLASRGGRGGAGAMRVAALSMAMSGVHDFCDLVAGGPTWPIYPVWPLSDFAWRADWSWTIGDWPNLLIVFVGLAGTLVYGKLAGRSPLECFGDRADAWLVGIVRQTRKADAATGGGRLRWIIWSAVALVVIAILAPLGFRPGG